MPPSTDGEVIMTCKHCGGKIEAHYKDLREDACFTCNYWLDQAAHPEGAFIHNGIHRRMGDGKSTMKGMGGRLYRIVMKDGTEHHCNDVWYQGPIPKHMLQLLPDTADTFELL